MNRLAEVGRVTPCAPSCVGQGIVVAAGGAQRTARPTFRFMESFNLQHRTRIGGMNRSEERGCVRSTSRSTSAYRKASNSSGTPWVARAVRLVLWTQPRSVTRRFMESSLILTDPLTGHVPGSAGIPAGEMPGCAGKDAGAPRFDLQHWTSIGAMNRHGAAQPSTAASSGGVSPPWSFVERDARRTRRRDACATGRLVARSF